MKKIAAIILATMGLTFALVINAQDVDYHKDSIEISNPDAHNAALQACIKAALERHPGAITEVEVETEDGQKIIDVDVQVTHGKSWEVECDALTGNVIEDKEGSDDKEEAKK
ncbi:MAG: PepSY domain-containing protein [Methylophilaceae bacterium]|nr:PepSY domain-containing protein [Methylophilaceae bacterium]